MKIRFHSISVVYLETIHTNSGSNYFAIMFLEKIGQNNTSKKRGGRQHTTLFIEKHPYHLMVPVLLVEARGVARGEAGAWLFDKDKEAWLLTVGAAVALASLEHVADRKMVADSSALSGEGLRRAVVVHDRM